MSTPKKKRNGKSPRGTRGSYERSTPIGRVLKNLDKVKRSNDNALARLAVWAKRDPEDLKLKAALEYAMKIDGAARQASDVVYGMVEDDWTPPKQSSAIVFEVGEEVKVADKYRPKYAEVYKKEVLDELVVSKISDSGEIVVKNGTTQFLTPKSHLVRRRIAAEVIAEVSRAG